MTPLVSVIIPSYNHASYIENAIQSVLDQSYQNFELIVIDDGSRDETAQLLRKRCFDSRVSIFLNDVNKGQSAVLNQALSVARGDFVCILPSDDWFLPDKLSLQVAKFDECNADVGVVYGRGYRYFSDSEQTLPVELPMYRGWVLERFVRESNFVYPVTPMFRRECFDFARPDESYRAEGEAIYLKLALKYQFEYVEDFVGVMRDHSYNTGKMSEMMYRDNVRYWNEFFLRDDIPDDIRPLRNLPLARLHRLKGLEAIALDGRYSDGRSALFKAILSRPIILLDPKVAAGVLLSYFPVTVVSFLLRRFRGR